MNELLKNKFFKINYGLFDHFDWLQDAPDINTNMISRIFLENNLISLQDVYTINSEQINYDKQNDIPIILRYIINKHGDNQGKQEIILHFTQVDCTINISKYGTLLDIYFKYTVSKAHFHSIFMYLSALVIHDRTAVIKLLRI